MKINIVTIFNGAGLETDYRLLRSFLEGLGARVTGVSLEDPHYPEADLNVFFEVFVPYKFSSAPLNWFVPNLEWFCNRVEDLSHFDLILCRTREAERIFQELYTANGEILNFWRFQSGSDLNDRKEGDIEAISLMSRYDGRKKLKSPPFAVYIGFTSFDCYQPEIEKDFNRMFHLCGKSRQKGTQSILDLWKEAPQLPDLAIATQIDWEFPPGLPNLIVRQGLLPEENLRYYQNHCGIHLCPSEAEGFGHSIMEAMSTGGVVVTTNAPPMNEFITEPLCLVPFTVSASQRLGTAYHVDSRHLRQVFMRLLQLPKEELKRIGAENRKVYLARKKEFQNNLKELLELTLMRGNL